MDEVGQVYGISDIPLNGNSILADETSYLLLLLLLVTFLTGTVFMLLRRKRSHAKLRVYVLFAGISQTVLLLSFTVFLATLLISSPSIASVSPERGEALVSIRNPAIRISFDGPIDRIALEKHITPDAPGAWAFENNVPGTNLYRDLVFYPSVTLEADTEYTVTLLNINGYMDKSAKAYTYSFRTQSAPRIADVIPSEDALDVDPEQHIEIRLDGKNEGISDFDFQLTPSHPLDIMFDEDSHTYTLAPREPFLQGVKYHLVAKKTNLAYQLPEGNIIKRDDTQNEYEGYFTTAEAPGINSFTPYGKNILPSTPITITFTNPMDRKSVEENFSMTPSLFGSFEWEGNTMTFEPFDMRYETEYKVNLRKGARAENGGYLPFDIEKSFMTIGSVAVASVYPEDGWQAVSVDSQIQVTFDQEVDRASAEDRFELIPPVTGVFLWNGNTMVFKPDSKLEYSKKYDVVLKSGVVSIYGLPSRDVRSFSFITQAQTVKLDVPSFIQKYTLSCEIAALRMALDYKGIKLSEDTLINSIGFDNTPYASGVWGDPHSAFVGNINGTQMVDGYGVYWEPIARVARNYRNAREFTGESTISILKEVEAGNPVIVWTYTKNGSPVTWNTTSGKLIRAVRGEHAVVVVGFVGRSDEPSKVIVNDPLVGQVFWTREYFEERWGSLGKSGVVVY